jgi:hypothetical protein
LDFCKYNPLHIIERGNILRPLNIGEAWKILNGKNATTKRRRKFVKHWDIH